MRKPVILFLAAFLYSSTMQAQLRIALAGGAHSSSVIETNDLPDWNTLKNNYSSRTGVHFGFLADLQTGPKSKFYFQPAIFFYTKGRSFFSEYDTAVFNYFSIGKNQFVNYIEAPLNLVYKFPIGKGKKLFLGAGPYASFFYNGKEKTETYLKSGSVTTEEISDLPVGNAAGKYSTMDIGANGVFGFEAGRFFISANYSRSVTDFYKATYNGSFKHQVIGGTMGIFIGKPIALGPKIKDTDKDEIPDEEDLCPDDAGPLHTKGCPDTDGDGIADINDKCPEVSGLAVNSGCPPLKDTDGDGVVDDIDNCINVPGSPKYRGCPVPDTDGDGINDDLDRCRTVPGLQKYNGCPIPDTDKDGVNNEEDSCITVPGLKENNGCPEVKQEIKEKIEYAAKRIQFEYTKALLLKESEKVLDEVAEILINNPELKLDIEGHTSNAGNFDANMKLSVMRAETVKKYLSEKGVDAGRLAAQGFGPTRPLNQNQNEADRAKNRRVELIIKNN